MANINELMDGWGFGKQTAIGTANLVAAIWRHTNLNTKPWAKVPVNEDDRAEIGKGHEFPTQLFKSHYNMPAFEISKYASSEFLAWAMSFALGNVTVSGSGPYTYTIVPALGATNPTGLELPYFSFVQQIRPGGSAVLDEMLVGCAVKGWKLSIKNSPGRASAMCSAECVTTGQYTSPSGITLPAISTPHEFNAGMISALTFNGINYLSGGSAKQFVSMDASWENNFRPGFFPGSGAQDGYQIQGRFEWGDRVFAVQFVVRVQAGSTEYANLINQTTGTATFTATRDANNSFTMLIQKMGFNVAELGNTDGIVTLQITGVQLYDPTNGMVTMTSPRRYRASANRSLEWKPKRKRASMRRSRSWCRSFRAARRVARCGSLRTRSGAPGRARSARCGISSGAGSRRARTWTCRRSTRNCSPRSAPTKTVPSSMMPRPAW